MNFCNVVAAKFVSEYLETEHVCVVIIVDDVDDCTSNDDGN